MSSAFEQIVHEDIITILQSDLPWERFHNKTILVTGAAGFLPAYMVDSLFGLKEVRGIECHVIGLVRDVARAQRRFAKCNASQLKLIPVDTPWNLNFSEPIHFIIHAASNASPQDYLSNRMATLYPNVMGTHELVALAIQNRLESFLFFSSAEVYGTQSAGMDFIDELTFGCLDPTKSRAVYAEGKRCGEAICAAARAELAVPTQVVRPFHTYGPGMRLDDGRIFADMVRDILRGGPLRVKSSGTAVRSFCYLRDATEAFFRVMLLGDGHAYNVGNPVDCVSVRDLAIRLVEMFPERNLKIEYANVDSVDAVSVVRPCISRLEALGWKPTTSLTDGFQRTVLSYE